MAERNDPFQGFRFKVEIQSLTVGGFSEATGFQAETQVEEIREGGNNLFVHRLPKETRFQNLVLKRGLTDSKTLDSWYADVVQGKIERKNVNVILLDRMGNETWCFSFKNAYPVKWIGSEFKAESHSVAVETVEFAHHGFERSFWGSSA
jgi:phage tail-like protein